MHVEPLWAAGQSMHVRRGLGRLWLQRAAPRWRCGPAQIAPGPAAGKLPPAGGQGAQELSSRLPLSEGDTLSLK